jgi:hypothetical protein
MSIGLNKKEIKSIIHNKLNKNADILIGVDDPEINELIEILIDAFSEAIVENNDSLENDLVD